VSTGLTKEWRDPAGWAVEEITLAQAREETWTAILVGKTSANRVSYRNLEVMARVTVTRKEV